MKIFCVGRNYLDHIYEMKGDIQRKPIIFMKPPTALIKKNDEFYIPEFSGNIHYEGEIVFQICKNGKYVQKPLASSYYDKIGFGIDFTARDIQQQCKDKGHPWEIAKSFDNSAMISTLICKEQFDITNINFQTYLNSKLVQSANSSSMIFDIDFLICYISTYFTLQKGDLIFSGTPAGVGKVNIDDKIEGYINDSKLLTCFIK